MAVVPLLHFNQAQFAQAESLRFFEWNTVCACWVISQEAYTAGADYTPSEAAYFSWLPTPTVVSNEVTGDMAHILKFEHFVVVAWRGTEGSLIGQKAGNTDVLTDIHITLTSYSDDVNQGQVHLGFSRSLGSTWATVSDTLKRLAMPILFVGHSLGGALAKLAALRAVDGGLAVQAVYTFGAPRVGDEVWADSYNRRLTLAGARLGDVTLRVVKETDLVPRFPQRHPGLLEDLAGKVEVWELGGGFPANGYRHVGRPLVFWKDDSVDCQWIELLKELTRPQDLLDFYDEGATPHTHYAQQLAWASQGGLAGFELGEQGPEPPLDHQSLWRSLLNRVSAI